MPALITHRLFGEESIERLPKGLITSDAVSYTHLDVYKRQGFAGAPSAAPSQFNAANR